MDAEVIRNVLNDLSTCAGEPLIVKPAEGMELKRLQEDLQKLADLGVAVPQAPADYLEFLEVANGLSWNGFEFFGTYQVTVKKSGYTLQDIVTMNDKMHERKMGLSNMLLLGRFDDDIYVYNANNGKYQALDSLTLTEIETCNTFDQLLILSLYPYVDDDDETDEDFEPDDEDYPIDDET
ncbi:MAG: YrhA family protein [Lachnospiraceae bacterium]|nr:YrhA family protein [Lachnospiraceae bacterium]